MSPFIRIPLGLFVIFIGYLMLRKTDVVLSWFGRVPFAEEKLGAGGSHLFYKLLGIAITFLGIFIATNVISGIMEDLAGLLTHTS